MAFIIAIMVTMLSKSAHADLSRCALIKNHDLRMLCYANVTSFSSYCAFIKDQDTRTRCFIMIKK